ncbi:dUTP diphosphatase [Candidatus Lariskella endosymbiont of Hedychridium roseum]|uniref:dUTP diphosphatase n=1 Tax=Candidatus Lariskella endosymbiont of Hedychridium roseum TaxID=3077949 RepID=UPI0030D02A0B
MRIHIKKLDNLGDLPMPTYATLQSAGLDLMAALNDEELVTIKPMERALIKTGIAIALPEGYEAQVRPRSGLAVKHGVTVLNTPGTIDADYRGEIAVILINLGAEDFVVTRGMRIAQMIISKYEHISWNIVDELPTTGRGVSGFGSTGQ